MKSGQYLEITSQAMSVKFRTHPFLRRFLDNQEEVEVEGNTVGECIDNLGKRYPAFKQQLLNNGTLRNIFEIYVNQDSAYPDELTKPVKDSDVVTIITYIAGG